MKIYSKQQVLKSFVYLMVFLIVLNPISARNFTVYNASDSTQEFFMVEGTTGRVGIGTGSPGTKLDVRGGLLAGGVNNGEAIFYRSSNPYSIGSTDAVLVASDRSNADWGIISDKTGYDYAFRANVANGANYAIGVYDGSSYTYRVKGNGDTYIRGNIVWHAGNDGADSGLYADYLGIADTRGTNPNPETYNMGVVGDFKSNGANGLSDGGSYNAVLSLRQWSGGGDWSGGGVHQLGFTQNGNLWHRYSQTSGVWGAWKKFVDSSSGITGSGTANYIPKFTGAQTLGNSIMYDNSGNIGIGTTSPQAKLHLTGDMAITRNNVGYSFSNKPAMMSSTNDGYLLTPTGTDPSDLRLYIEDDATDMFSIWGNSCGGGGCWNLAYSSKIFEIKAGGQTYFKGNVGIGTASPAKKLHVQGDIRATGYGVFPGGIAGAVTGAPDVPIWIVSGDQYNNWGIFYNEGSPDYIEFKAGGSVTSKIALDNGHFYSDLLYDDTGSDWSIGGTGENLEFREPEDGNKVWGYFQDDWGLRLTGAPNLQVTGSILDGSGYTKNMASYEWNWWGRRYTGWLGSIQLSLFTHFYDVDEAPAQTSFQHTANLNSNAYLSGSGIWGAVHSYHAIWTTQIHVNRQFTISSATLNGDDPYSLYIDNKYVAGSSGCCSGTTYSYTFTRGWHKIDMIYSEAGGGHYVQLGWNPSNYLAYIDAMNPFGPMDYYNDKTLSFREGNVGIGTTNPTGKLDIRGDEVRIWDGSATVNYATSQGELYVEGDLEVDGNIYGNIAAVNVEDIWVNESGDTMSGALTMADNNILDANTVQANTLEDPEDGILSVNDDLHMGGNRIWMNDGSFNVRNTGDYFHQIFYNDGITFKTNVGHGHFRFYGGTNTDKGGLSTLVLDLDTQNNVVTIPTGTVGIGTATPRAKLHVANTYSGVFGSDGMLKIKSIDNGGCCGTEAITLQTTIDSRTDDYTPSSYGGDARHVLSLQPQGGFVGIGTASPQAKLQVIGGDIYLGGDTGAGRANQLLKIAGDSTSKGIQIYADDYFDDNTWGTRMWKDHHGSGIGLQIDTQYGGTWYESVYIGHGQIPADPRFGVFGGATIGSGYTQIYSPPSEGLIVQGSVGIGTTSPGYKLHVYGNAGTATRIYTDGLIQDVSGVVHGNYISSHSWNIGTGSVGIFGQNGATSENTREWGVGPQGNRVILWKGGNDVGNDADGGWGTSSFPIDHTKKYRVSVWIKKTNSNAGTTYFGIGTPILTLGGVGQGNPYFFCGDLPSLNKWYLVVGVIHGSGDSSTTSEGGIYDGETGKKVISWSSPGGQCSGDYKFSTSTTTQYMRTYLYYDVTTADRQYWWDPRFEEVNGKEPSIQALLDLPRSNTNGMYWGSGAAIGIGTTAPSNELEVNGDIELTNLYDNDASNFFDGSCSVSETLNTISSTGAISCQAISLSAGSVEDIWVNESGDTMSGTLNINAGTANGPNDASLYVSATNNNDWGLVVNKFTGGSTEYGADIRVSDAATYGLRILGSGAEKFRVSGAGNVYVAGNLNVQGVSSTFGSSAYTNIYMRDDESTGGAKRIHANSNVIGFLSGAGSWLTYWDTSGNQQNTGSITATNYYTGGWFRNSGRTGMYSTSYGGHLYWDSASYLDLSNNNGIRFRSSTTYDSALAGYIYHDSNGFGLLDSGGSWAVNIPPGREYQVIIGGYQGANAYNSYTSRRLMFGGGNADAQANYYIGTNMENYGGNYNKLDLRWHTGIRMGAQPSYGGIRFFDSEDLGTKIFSIGETDNNVRVTNNLYVGGTVTAPTFVGLSSDAQSISLVTTGGTVVTGNTVTYSGSSSGWNAQAYSKDGYPGGAYVSVVVDNLGHSSMFGLNRDPTADASYCSIDYAWYITGGTNGYIYESCGNSASGITLAVGDVLAVTYDGISVKYLQNGVVRRTVTVAITVPLYFDSSFHTAGVTSTFSNLRFGAMTSAAYATLAGNANACNADATCETGAIDTSGPISIYDGAASSNYPLHIKQTSVHQYLTVESTGTYEAMTRYYNPTAGNWYTGIRAGDGTELYHIYNAPISGTASDKMTISKTGVVTATTFVGALTGTASNADLLDSIDSTGFSRAFGTQTFGASTTTAAFITDLTNKGFFNYPSASGKGSWWYAGNSDIGDTGYGAFELAGTALQTWTDGSYKTVLAIRPTTGAGGGQILVYNDQGSGYSPGWRQIWTSTTDGSGSGLDADSVDSIHASQIPYGGAGRASTSASNMDDPNQKSGFYYYNQPTGRPINDWVNWITSAGNSWQSSNNYEFQLAHAFHSDSFYVRRITNGGASSWRQIIDSGNIASQNVATANKVNGYGSSPDNSHPGSGARPFYSWNTGRAYSATTGYSNGITIGSHPGDPNYGFQIVSNMWDDHLYFRRYNYGWQSWRTVVDDTTIGSYSAGNAYACNADATCETTALIVGGTVSEKTFNVFFTNSVANQKVDLYFPAGFWGWMEIDVTSTYSYQNSPGVVKKTFALGLNPAGAIYTNVARYSESQGATPDNWAISDVTWDAVNSRYKVQIVHRVSTQNTAYITVRGHSSNTAIIQSMGATGVYTTDTTVFPRPEISFVGSVGIGTVSPGSKLHISNSYTASTKSLIINNANTALPSHTSYDTVLIAQEDVPSIRLRESPNAQELTLAVGNEYSNRATLGSTGALAFATGRSAGYVAYGNAGTKMIIESGGNVGIGTASPSAPLDISGGTSVTGTIAGSYGIIASSRDEWLRINDDDGAGDVHTNGIYMDGAGVGIQNGLIVGGSTLPGAGQITANTQFNGPGTGLTGTAASLTAGLATNAYACNADGACGITNVVFPYTEWDYSWGSHTQTNPMSIRLYDSYTQPGAPSSYGTLMDIYGLSGHQQDQFYFYQGNIIHRYGWYGNNNWNAWQTMITSSNIGSQSVNYATTAGNAYACNADATCETGIITATGSVSLDGGTSDWFKNGNAWFGRNAAYNTAEIRGYGAELMIGSQNAGSLHINYRQTSGANAPATWYWRAGSSSSWSNHNFGAVTANGVITSTGDANIQGNELYFGETAQTIGDYGVGMYIGPIGTTTLFNFITEGATIGDLNVDSATLFVDASANNVGIGTTVPITNSKLHISGGDNSMTYYGPNAIWSGYLWVGAGTNRIAASTAQVISTNGNLHIDPGTGNDIYMNYYAARPTRIHAGSGTLTAYFDTTGRTSLGSTTAYGGVGDLTIMGNDLYDSGGDTFFEYSGYAASKTVSSISSAGTVGYTDIAIAASQTTSGIFNEARVRKLDSVDTRATNPLPQDYTSSVQADFKQNSADGLSDGGTYHGVISFRTYGGGVDDSGGPMHQLGFTGNGNLWRRTATGDTTWGSWTKFWHTGNDHAGTNIAADLEEETHGTEHDGTDGDYVKDSGDTMAGTLNMNNNIITNIGNAGTDFIASTGALTLAGLLTLSGNTIASSTATAISLSADDVSVVGCLNVGSATECTTQGNIQLSSGATRTITIPVPGAGDGDDLKISAAGGAPLCFAGETKIRTNEGNVSLKDLKVGNQILGYDILNNQFKNVTVQNTLSRNVSSYYLLNGYIKVTEEHPFYTDKGWKKVKDLQIGDYLFTIEESWEQLNHKELVNETLTVFNLQTDNTNTYFAEGYLVHNKGTEDGGDLYLYGGYANTAVEGNVILAHTGTLANGNVGIGTATPLQILHVVGDANITSTLNVGGNILVEDDKFIGSQGILAQERIVFDQDGNDIEILGANVGIGTTTPDVLLDIEDSLVATDKDTTYDINGVVASMYIDTTPAILNSGYNSMVQTGLYANTERDMGASQSYGTKIDGIVGRTRVISTYSGRTMNSTAEATLGQNMQWSSGQSTYGVMGMAKVHPNSVDNDEDRMIGGYFLATTDGTVTTNSAGYLEGVRGSVSGTLNGGYTYALHLLNTNTGTSTHYGIYADTDNTNYLGTGNTGIGTTSPSRDLSIYNGAAYSIINAGVSTFTASSSRDLKENIQGFEFDPEKIPRTIQTNVATQQKTILDRFKEVNVYSYNFKREVLAEGEEGDDAYDETRIGMMAEDFHYAFGLGNNESINGDHVMAMLVLGIKELTNQVEILEGNIGTASASEAGTLTSNNNTISSNQDNDLVIDASQGGGDVIIRLG